MAITASQFSDLMANASKEGTDAFNQGAESARQAKEQALRKFLTGQKEGTIGPDGTYTPGTDTQGKMTVDKLNKGQMIPEQSQTTPGQQVELPGPTQNQQPLMGRTPDQTQVTPAHYAPGLDAQQKEFEMSAADRIKGDAQARELSLAQKALDANGGAAGGTAKVGDTSLGSKEFNIYAGAQKERNGEAAAVNKANDFYNHGYTKLSGAAKKIQEGLDAVNDPKQVGSVGAAKSLLISGVAEMNRYNQQEGGEIVPSGLLQKINQYANGLGNDNNPLTDVQRRSINSLLMGGLGSLNDQHETLKNTALSSFASSPYYNQPRADLLKQNLGAPFTQQLQNFQKKYGNTPTTRNIGAAPSADSPPAPPPAKGIQNLWGLLGKTPPASDSEAAAKQRYQELLKKAQGQ